MIETYTTNMKTKRSTNDLNACIKSLYNFIKGTEFKSTTQNYIELSYSGLIKELDIQITNPKQLGKNVPVIGYVNGSIPVYLGTTNGETCEVTQPEITTPPLKDDETVDLGYTWKQYDDQNNPSTITITESDTTTESKVNGDITKTVRTVISLKYTYTGEHREESYQHGEKYHHYYHYLKQRITNTSTTYSSSNKNTITVLQRI
jgi:hypothetical protein